MISRYKPIGDGYSYGYMIAGTGKARWVRMPLLDQFRLWRRRRRVNDLDGIR